MLFASIGLLKVAIFLCSGWLIIFVSVFSIYLKMMISDERHVMAVCWFRRVDWRTVADRDHYWFEAQILLTTILTIFLPISLIVACNIRVLTIGKLVCRVKKQSELLFSAPCTTPVAADGIKDAFVCLTVTNKKLITPPNDLFLFLFSSSANYQRHRIASAIYESVLSAQVAITHQKNPFPPVPNMFPSPFPLASLYPPKPNPFELRRKSQKAAIVVFELIASVVILYSPYYLFVIFFNFYRKSQHFASQTDETAINVVIYLVQFLMLCSPTMNAILYGFKDKTIQENVQNIWRKQKTKIELHYEIQARTPSTCGSRKASLTEVTANMYSQPPLKRQLSDFFFGTSSSLTSHLHDDGGQFFSHKIHRTPSDSFFATSNGRKDSMHHEYLSPNFDPLGKISISTNTSSTTSPPVKSSITPSPSKNLLNNFKKLIVGSRSDMHDSSSENHFPQILITKHSDTSLLNGQATSRRESDIQQVALEEDLAEKEPLLTTQTRSLDDFGASGGKRASHKFQTL